MKCVAIIQARMGSTRLAGKTLVDISGQPLLSHIIDRVRASRRVDEVVVATTTGVEDDAVVRLAVSKFVGVFRGSTNDVLDRYYHAALASGAQIVVRITADDPFKDPDVIDLVTDSVLAGDEVDYASNTLEPTFPEGLDVETIRFDALARAWREARLDSEREHVTPYIWKHPDRFRIVQVRHPVDLSSMRWTLDYDEDLRFVRAVYERLYRGHIFRMREILDLIVAEPDLARINSGFVRNAGYLKSVKSELPPSSPT